jgi:hypothetical protein
MKRLTHVVALLVVTTFTATGCQVLWASITSVSDSISGSSQAIGGSLQGLSTSVGLGSGGGANVAYQEDVRVLTYSFVASGEREDHFLRDLGRVAEQHGLLHWEIEPATWFAIGAGLHEAGVAEGELDAFLGRAGLGTDYDRAVIREGFRAAGL